MASRTAVKRMRTESPPAKDDFECRCINEAFQPRPPFFEMWDGWIWFFERMRYHSNGIVLRYLDEPTMNAVAEFFEKHGINPESVHLLDRTTLFDRVNVWNAAHFTKKVPEGVICDVLLALEKARAWKPSEAIADEFFRRYF